MPKNKKKDGISLRTINIWLIIGAVILSGLMVFSTYRLDAGFKELTKISEKQIELRNAANELMDASDYLTECVQRFTVVGEEKYLKEYFKEAFETKRREEALSIISSTGNEKVLKELQEAMDNSLSIMNIEYYAMKLVVLAKGITNYHETLNEVVLLDEDLALLSDEKMKKAAIMVHDDEYYNQKNKIRNAMEESIAEIETYGYENDASTLSTIRKRLIVMRVVFIIQILGVIFIVWLTSRLTIYPLLNAVNQIKTDKTIPEIGGNEFRYLARTYNKMYDVYKTSMEHLNFKASHDELTGAYNRSGYQLIISSITIETTYMLIIDIDNFKTINDTYGHEIGDELLVKLVRILKNNFRSDDYICRIGGDEFVIFLTHTTPKQNEALALKVSKINQELKDSTDGLPSSSISAGIAHGSEFSEFEELYKKADEALYKAKNNGKHTYYFYENNQLDKPNNDLKD